MSEASRWRFTPGIPYMARGLHPLWRQRRISNSRAKGKVYIYYIYIHIYGCLRCFRPYSLGEGLRRRCARLYCRCIVWRNVVWERQLAQGQRPPSRPLFTNNPKCTSSHSGYHMVTERATAPISNSMYTTNYTIFLFEFFPNGILQLIDFRSSSSSFIHWTRIILFYFFFFAGSPSLFLSCSFVISFCWSLRN